VSAGRNKVLVRRVIEGFLNSGDSGLAGKLFSPGYVDNNPSNPGMGGLENVKRSVADWHRAFPDTVNEVGDVLAEGDLAAARWVTSGVFRVEAGKVAESWDHFDALGLLGQLGVTFRS
jgi:predicted SnoaL-like aldol condensation-catalyzing enzyme